MKSEYTKNTGFTLIEILVVFALMGVMSAVGFAAYATFNGTQSVQSSTSDVVNLLSTAKDRAISQVIPPQCAGKALTGYQVQVTVSGGPYTLNAICSGTTYLIQTKKLPASVTFSSSSTASVTFMVSSGTPTSPAAIAVTGYGKSKAISVSTTGIIMVN